MSDPQPTCRTYRHGIQTAADQMDIEAPLSSRTEPPAPGSTQPFEPVVTEETEVRL